jgi:prolyl-tRNA editing enzyme YbaK/EbsC (Cys-tRNA(Pro) deacylase)
MGGVSRFGWINPATVVIDLALQDYEEVWAAAGHPHTVFPTIFEQLQIATGAQERQVSQD